MLDKRIIRIELHRVCPLVDTAKFKNPRQNQCEIVGSQAFYKACHNNAECHSDGECLAAKAYPEVVHIEVRSPEYRRKCA